MIKFFTSLWLLMTLGVSQKIIRVIDGDTLLIEANWVPNPLPKQIYLRVYGIDAPEIKSKCQQERQMAYLAKEFTQTFTIGQNISIDYLSWDKYGGRILGAVRAGSLDLSEQLIEAGFVRPYSGKLKKPWCSSIAYEHTIR
jgi:micrococcal nuclease